MVVQNKCKISIPTEILKYIDIRKSYKDSINRLNNSPKSLKYWYEAITSSTLDLNLSTPNISNSKILNQKTTQTKLNEIAIIKQILFQTNKQSINIVTDDSYKNSQMDIGLLITYKYNNISNTIIYQNKFRSLASLLQAELIAIIFAVDLILEHSNTL